VNQRARELLGRLTGTQVFSRLPGGVQLSYDLRHALPRSAIRVVFDVGANVGKTATRYLRQFPEADVFCFEPVSSTFAALQGALAHEPRARCFRLALTAARGSGTMQITDNSVSCRLLEPGADGGPDVEPVETDTIDAFCAEHKVERIDLLKIDTEGGDLDVLRGAEAMLGEMRIDVLQVEAGMNPQNRVHVDLQAFRAHLEPRGYFLFRLYNQAAEVPTGEPHLRRCDPVFVSQRVIELNRNENRRHSDWRRV
jgi:FkbM family methyltransferase